MNFSKYAHFHFGEGIDVKSHNSNRSAFFKESALRAMSSAI
ncbi:MAG: hypothetical protein Q9M36_01015 [Sulfurovum sp.]|nr:hypothetical protein [Sulfurovum sp.]